MRCAMVLSHITDMNLSFENKVALITGAGSGMGLTTARAFAEAGAAVALADVNENAVRSAAEELVVAGHTAIAIRCNVADEAEVAAMVEQTVSALAVSMPRSITPAYSLRPWKWLMSAAKNSSA